MADDVQYAQQLLGITPEALTEIEQEDTLLTPEFNAVLEEPVAVTPAVGVPEVLAPNPVAVPAVNYDFLPPTTQAQMGLIPPEAVPVDVPFVAQNARADMGLPAPGAEMVSPELASTVDNELAQQAVQKATTPEPQAVEAAAAQALEPIKQQRTIAEANKKVAMDLRADMLRERQDAEDQQKKIQAELDKTDESVRIKSLPEIMQRGSFGEKLGASIALLMGAVSQGISGAKTNPVMDFIDRQVEEQGKRDKLRSEEKLALKKQLVDLAQVRLKALADASDDAYKKGVLGQGANELALRREQIEGEQRLKAEELAAKYSTGQIASMFDAGQRVDSLAGLSEDQRKRAVTLPGGGYKSVTNPAIAEKLNVYRSEIEPAVNGIDRIFGLINDFNRVTDLKKRAQIGTEVKALTGQLRLAFLGPGAMTEKEYERLLSTVGDPNQLMAFPSLEKAKLKTVQDKLKSDIRLRYSQAGIELPKSRREELVDKLTQNGKFTKEQVEAALSRKGM